MIPSVDSKRYDTLDGQHRQGKQRGRSAIPQEKGESEFEEASERCLLPTNQGSNHTQPTDQSMATAGPARSATLRIIMREFTAGTNVDNTHIHYVKH